MKTAVFTIVSNNYSAQARVLCQSLRLHEPSWERHVLLVDTPSAEPLIPEEEAPVLPVSELPLPVSNWFFFQYSIIEANTAVKPWMFARLFDQGYDHVIYFDPDIRLYSPLDELRQRLLHEKILLTPHLTRPYRDRQSPGEKNIRQAGIHNLGFAAMRKSAEAQEALAWWQEKLTHDCRSAMNEGIFVDQSWMDFAPAFFGARLLDHPGYNVAYWNLHERPLSLPDFPSSPPICKGKPLGFFHFSGFDYRYPHNLSKYQDRYQSGHLPAGVPELLQDYANALVKNGIQDTGSIPFGLHALDGLQIPDFLRCELLKVPAVKAMIYSNAPVDGLARLLMDYLCSPDPYCPSLPFFLGRLYARRSDLKQLFPDCRQGCSIHPFLQWFESIGRHENGFSTAFPSHGWWCHETRWQKNIRQVWENMPERILRRRKLAGLLKSLVRPIYKKSRKHRPQQSLALPRGRPGKIKINLYGYFLAHSGMGEVARSLSRSLSHLGLEHRIIHLEHGGKPGSFPLPLSLPDSRADIDIVAVNADSMKWFLQQFPETPGQRRYRVGYWLWELETPPPGFSEAERLVDEIWCASGQNAATFRKRSRVPVRVAGLNLSDEWNRPHPFPFPEMAVSGRCLFLTLCNCQSYPERKNPVAALQAYLQAFPKDRGDTLMLVKLSNSQFRPDTVEQLQKLAEGRQDVIILDTTLSPEETMGLFQHIHALVSLHTQEGFGLPIAEALYLGKEVVVTAYGGNMDFCNPDNSHLVPFRLATLEKDIGPYSKGNAWAQPDVSAAADFLRSIRSRWKHNPATRPPSREINETCRRRTAENIKAIEQILFPGDSGRPKI